MFLDKCIDSALNQTYKNIEIVVLDNCSDDNSLEVASKYICKGVRVCKNPRNIGNKSYNVLSSLMKGKYLMLLPADDMLKSEFIEKAVNILEQNPNVGYIHCERDYVDAEGSVTELDPFYNCSFIAPGESVLPVYMLTDVGQPAQSLMRRSTFDLVKGYNSEFDHTNADKDMWFRLSLISDYAYLREKLSLIRIHKQRETTLGFQTFYHPLAIYLLLYNQSECGKLKGYQNVIERLPQANRKLAIECIRIAFSFLDDNERHIAKQYMLFSQIICEDIITDDKFIKLQECLNSPALHDSKTMNFSEKDMFARRIRNYDPPEGYQVLKVGYASAK
jgi:glycosyltransferase involved in cell wall biosynthesis